MGWDRPNRNPRNRGVPERACCSAKPQAPGSHTATKLRAMRAPTDGHASWRKMAREGCYFTRVSVDVLQNIAATQPDRSSSFLLLTVTVPE